MVEIARHHPLHGIAIVADDLTQELDGQQVLPLALFLDDDLGEDRAGDVIPAFGVVDHEVDALLHHLAEMIQSDVAAGRRIVRSAIAPATA